MSSSLPPDWKPSDGLVRQLRAAFGRRPKGVPKSAAEEQFSQQLAMLKLDHCREYLFHPTRKWRADFYLPDLNLLVEIEGVSPTGTRHQRIAGFKLDIQKYAEAVSMGYNLLRITPDQVPSGKAIEYITRRVDPENLNPGMRKAAFDRWLAVQVKKMKKVQKTLESVPGALQYPSPPADGNETAAPGDEAQRYRGAPHIATPGRKGGGGGKAG